MPTHPAHLPDRTADTHRDTSRAQRHNPVAALLAAAFTLVGGEAVFAQNAAGPNSGRAVIAVSDAARSSYRSVLQQANAFLDTLSEQQRTQLLQPYSFANAARWHTYPEWSFSRNRGRLGLRLDTLSDSQWQALFALLEAALGSGRNQGFEELQQHLIADDYLNQIGAGDGYGRGDFKVAFLGTPSETGLWQLQFGGHHFAVSNTYREGVLNGATPSFRGIEPLAPFEHQGTVYAPQQQEHEAFQTLLASLDADQLARARLSGRFRDVVMMAGNDWTFPDGPQGIPASELTRDQQRLLQAAIAGFVEDVDDVSAAFYMDRYMRDLPETYVSFAGSPRLTEVGEYARVEGPSLWLEMFMDPPYSSNDAHPHAVWRDKQLDYGGARPE